MTELILRNRQRVYPIRLRFFRRVARLWLEDLLGMERYQLGVEFVGDAAMAKANDAFLNHKGPTDVITFDYADEPDCEGLAGEIWICPAVASAQGARFRASWQEEVFRYFIHGVLHLRGHDDQTPDRRRRMKREENRWARELGARFDLKELERAQKGHGSSTGP